MGDVEMLVLTGVLSAVFFSVLACFTWLALGFHRELVYVYPGHVTAPAHAPSFLPRKR